MYKTSKNSFTKNGKLLKSLTFQGVRLCKVSEQVTSLFEESIAPEAEKKGVVAKGAKATILFCASIGNRINDAIDTPYKYFKKHIYKKINRKFALGWGISSSLAFSFVAGIALFGPFNMLPQNNSQYYIFSTKPLTLEETTNDIYAKDSRSQRIDQVFKSFSCPLTGLGDVFVHEADKNNIPWTLVAAISFKESTCGKFTPKISGNESYNAWGYAIYNGSNVGFDDWEKGIETVSKYLGDTFYSKGITNTCTIMKTYTPPSNGSWCQDVDYFTDMISNYKSPQTK
jgi:hypothetical protein